ncbi:MAG: hypothetical protein AB3N28_04685 [Kordiimonas sp.]
MKIKLEFLVSATAMITAVAAVVVSVVQTDVMRDEAEMERQSQRLSVMPSVWLEMNNSASAGDPDAPGHFEFVVINHGLGPASLKSFTVQRDDKYVKNWSEWLSYIDKDKSDIEGITGLSYHSLPPKYVLPQGQQVQAYSIRAKSRFIGKIERALNDSVYTLCFCSFYDDCWITSGLNTAPEPVDECKINTENQFVSRRDRKSVH